MLMHTPTHPRVHTHALSRTNKHTHIHTHTPQEHQSLCPFEPGFLQIRLSVFRPSLPRGCCLSVLMRGAQLKTRQINRAENGAWKEAALWAEAGAARKDCFIKFSKHCILSSVRRHLKKWANCVCFDRGVVLR